MPELKGPSTETGLLRGWLGGFAGFIHKNRPPAWMTLVHQARAVHKNRPLAWMTAYLCGCCGHIGRGGASHQPAGMATFADAAVTSASGTCPLRRLCLPGRGPSHQPAGHVFPGGDAFADAGRGDVDHGGGDDFYPETPGQSLFEAMESIWNAFACIKDIGRRT